MKKIEHLLVALDLTEMDDHLIRYSNFLVKKFQAKNISFIHVVKSYDIPKNILADFPDMNIPLTDIIREWIKEKTDELYKERKNTKMNINVAEGYTTENIIRYSRENKIDLTLIGKKLGYQGKGGVTRKIMSLTPSSILLVSETARPEINHLLVRMDFNKISEMALKTALYVKEATGAKISCFHVAKLPLKYFSRESVSNLANLEEKMKNHNKKEFEKLLKRLKLSSKDIPFQSVLDTENQEELYLYRQALKTGADMIMLGSRIKSEMADIILENTSEKLAASEKNISVFIVKDRTSTTGFLEALFD
ncbi:MAG: universal stress protein [Bacteroidales bacterium]